MYCIVSTNAKVLKNARINNKKEKKKKLHGPGIEPGPPAWQARILPLNHPCLHDVMREICVTSIILYIDVNGHFRLGVSCLVTAEYDPLD